MRPYSTQSLRFIVVDQIKNRNGLTVTIPILKHTFSSWPANCEEDVAGSVVDLNCNYQYNFMILLSRTV